MSHVPTVPANNWSVRDDGRKLDHEASPECGGDGVAAFRASVYETCWWVVSQCIRNPSGVRSLSALLGSVGVAFGASPPNPRVLNPRGRD